jgi:cystathionine beta-synthase
MDDHGFVDRARSGDLRDVVRRRHSEGAVVTVRPSDALTAAYQAMKLYDVSQLPVVEDGRILGIIDESDLLLAAAEDQGRLQEPVGDFMTTRLTTVPAHTPVKALMPIFDAGLVPIVVDGDEFVGLVTRMDVIHFFRMKRE